MIRLLSPARILPAVCLLLLLAALRASAAETVDTDPLNRTPEVRHAFQLFYNMEYESAMPLFEQIQRQHPGDPIATDYLLDAELFRELNRLDLLDTTFYANDGFLTGKHTVVEDPQMRDRIRSLSDQAISQASAELKTNPNDVNALFARGWAHSLEATYLAMVERAFGSGLHQALDAHSDCARVLQLDPGYTDAKLVAGVYQYVVGALPFAFKLLVGVAGIHGSKTQGMALLRDDTQNGVITRVAASTSMMLFLRREGRYNEAADIARNLSVEYPHDYLFKLEEANLQKDGGEGMMAVDTYEQLIDKAQHSGYYKAAHLELAYFGLGESLRGQKLYARAIDAYNHGAWQPTTSPELKRRCLLRAGETYDLMSQHKKAVEEYQAVMNAGGDTVQGELARKYMHAAYTGN